MKEQSLFNSSKIKQLMNKHKTELKINNEKREIVHNWNNEFKEGKLKEEKVNYINFSIEILTKLLGYNNKGDYTFEEKHDDKHPVEFTLLKNKEPYAVIELKGSDTNLDKRYNNKISAVEQAFNYATKKQSIQWVIVSNYYKFRLYNKSNQEDYISFNIEELNEINTSKKPENLQLFLLIFSKYSLLDNNIISNLYKSTILIEQNLESNFYKLFSETRLMIIAELQNNHPEKTKTEIIHYAQSILNRYIFICFAEDLGLLPPETSTETLITPINHKNLFKNTLWDRLNELFMFVNEGNPDKNIESYNGGLFKEDFDNIKIRDFVDDFTIFNESYQKWDFEKYSKAIEDKIGNNYKDRINPIFKNLLVVSSFNFSSELDVNILGHIFENSIGELEKIKEEDYSKKTPNNKGRRKKDGIFYTPNYITQYICENTIIPYLSKNGKAKTINDLISQHINEIDILDEKLKNIKIIDPACGSGAFLNKATDILLNIHKTVHDMKYENNKSLDPYFDDIGSRRKIILNNIYGVDLNEESIEITKLAMFLKIAKKGLKLPNLDKNIKCGNSLISDSNFIDNAFNWEKEYPEVFKNDGFDIVIGNPPYVRIQNIPHTEIDYYKKKYITTHEKVDLSILFIELSQNILKNDGMTGFISSNAFLNTDYGEKLRQIFLKTIQMKLIIDFGDLPIFKDALTYVSIFIFSKSSSQSFKYSHVKKLNQNLNSLKFENINLSNLDKKSWPLKDYSLIKIFEKLKKHPPLKKIAKCWVGIISGADDIFIFENIGNIDIENEMFIPLLRSGDCKRYSYSKPSKYIIYPYKLYNEKTEILPVNEIEKYPKFFNYLKSNENKLRKRKDSRKTLEKEQKWYKLIRHGNLNTFKKEKIVFPGESKQNKFGIDISGSGFSGARVFSITMENSDYSIKYLLAVLNSKLMEKYLHSITPMRKGGYHSYSTKCIDSIPFLN
ncbi:MAG: Eco57I restriction-modification methylase domain-containing protein [Methanobrevibacter sp.]|jgi:hypothetical protein|nr:Eco57I restriction-modification methylase domain-containing protein [Methanobrevibacter sp.]